MLSEYAKAHMSHRVHLHDSRTRLVGPWQRVGEVRSNVNNHWHNLHVVQAVCCRDYQAWMNKRATAKELTVWISQRGHVREPEHMENRGN